MSEIERFQQLVALVEKWFIDCAEPDGSCFMPDKEGDRIAKNRTLACARALLRVLAGPMPGEIREIKP